ncbi:MAG: gamma-glutamylcyclotransferase family protein [Panacibacter sp.]
MKQDQHHLFVYGSLRQGFHHAAHQYISRYFSFVYNGKIKGILSDMGDYPAATPCEEDNYIIGELYVINNEEEFNWAMEQLDEYEGLFPEVDEGEKVLFRREMTTVFTDCGETRLAWVYWYNNDVTGRPIIDSGDVIQYVKDKYK